MYLPEDPKRHVTRDYLFVLVNTLDPAFFPCAVEEIERKKFKSKPMESI